MSPFKSSLARSAAKLLGLANQADLSLRGTVQSNRVPPIPPLTASGGTKITSGSDVFHVFLGASEQDFSVTAGGECEVLVIAGGGSGGYFYGRGGGAGGIVHAVEFPVETGTYKVSAGDGAATTPVAVQFGNNGSDSYLKPSPAPAAPSATNLYAMGGGGGGYSGDPTIPAPIIASTGSGGGTTPPGTYNPSFPSTTQHPTANKYSNAGGLGGSSTIGGGGGGAGSVGNNVPNPSGGNGRPFSNFPAPVIAPTIPTPVRSDWTTAVGPTGLFGGGGAAYGTPGTHPRSPGGGGGWDDPASGIHNAINYTGSGGGGPNPSPGIGGNGIVIIHYTN